LNAGEELTIHQPWIADHLTSNGGDRLQVVVEYQNDTDNANNSDITLEHVQVARDPLKEHALEVSLNAPFSAIEGQTHTSSVTVTNHGPNVATSRSLVFSPSYLIPVTAPPGCTLGTSSDAVVCDLTGMTVNTSRTFVFSGTAFYQQWTDAGPSAYVTSSGNDLDSYPQGQSVSVSVDRDPNTLHSLELMVSGVPAEYFVHDPVNASITVTNHGPSVSPVRDLILQQNLLNLVLPAGCNDEGWAVDCRIPSLGVGATWTRTLTGTASTQGTNGYLSFSLSGNEFETYAHNSSFYQDFPVRGYVGTFGTAFAPAPPLSFDISTPQTFTVVISNTGAFSSVPDTLRIQLDRPDGAILGGISTTGLTGCEHILANAYQQIKFCAVPVIPVGGSWSFSYSVTDTAAGRFRIQAEPIGGNERTGSIAYHEIDTTNGLPLTLVWKPGSEPPSSPPGFVYGQSHPFAVNITNPNSSSKSFSLEVSIPESGYAFNLSGPASCSITTNPASFNPGDDITRIATCPITLSAGQTSSVFFSANFPACDHNDPVKIWNCSSTVRIAQVKARVIGAVATPLFRNVKVNQ
jgi:hypothetical protein